jgi:drug/metabolite transporter (DMT)-like permease
MKARRPQQRSEAKLSRSDLPWLIGAIFFGGGLAPIALLFGLRTTPAATASLLLNFEGVATALIAAAIFKEAIGKRVALSIGLITLASIVLSLEGGQWGLSAGMALILLATFSWGLDNNFPATFQSAIPSKS